MFLLLLLGLSVAVGAAMSGDSDPDTDEETGSDEVAMDEVPLQQFGDDDQFLIAQESESAVEEGYDDLVAEGILTQFERDTAIEEIDFVEGPLNVDTAGGDDVILAGQFDDKIDAGSGSDLVVGGAGDDEVDLGDGDDFYAGDLTALGLDVGDADALEGFAIGLLDNGDLGDDSVQGGAGNDIIADSFGANELSGDDGSDLILSIDQDGVTPDVVDGGAGDDILLVDEGDTVTTGDDSDIIVIDVSAGVSDDYEVVTITDFDPTQDTIFLDDSSGLVLPTETVGLGGIPESLVSVTETDDGTGAVVSINGTPVLVVTNDQGLSATDVSAGLFG